ncbi:hypothetical protein ACNNMX_10430 [Aerococcus viridans]|uniref:hypothetical protein n=1 Tax=Aerococcus viridans TaxID=1377 RepID=UPI003AA7FA2C
MSKEFKDYLTSEIGNDFKFVFLDGKTLVANLKKTKRYNYVVQKNEKEIHIFKHVLKLMYRVD